MEVKPYEIIVVDSCSSDDTAKLQHKYPIRYLRIKERCRQRARNLGISVARGDVIAFLDDDVVVDKCWLKHLLETYNHDSVGGVGGRVIPYGEGRDYYVPIKHYEVGVVKKDGLVLGNFDTPLPEPIEVDHLVGCNMSFRRELLLAVGGFDENFKGNCFRDDTDLCLRIKRLGYKLVYQPKALVWHKFRGKKVSNEWVYWYVRNNTYFYMKNVFPNAKLYLPVFLIRQFFPPKDYVQKSGIKADFNIALPWLAIMGTIEGFKTYFQNKSPKHDYRTRQFFYWKAKKQLSLPMLYTLQQTHSLEIKLRQKFILRYGEHICWIKARFFLDRSGATVLDAGCGRGAYLKFLRERGKEVVGLELRPELAKIAKKSGQVVVGDVLNPPFRSSSFDTILMGDVLEHLEDDAAALRRAMQIAKKNILVSVPRVELRGHDPDHKRLYSIERLRDLARNLRLECEIVKWFPSPRKFLELPAKIIALVYPSGFLAEFRMREGIDKK